MSDEGPCRVLIVEDETIVALMLAHVVTQAGMKPIASVIRGSDALSISRDSVPQIAIIDVHLRGDLDGLAVARLLRRLAPVVLIIITGDSDPALRAEIESLEPAAYLYKPFVVHELIALLRSVAAAVTRNAAHREARDN